MPGRLVFSTTADGASSPTERMRITEAVILVHATTGSYFTANNAVRLSLQRYALEQLMAAIATFHCFTKEHTPKQCNGPIIYCRDSRSFMTMALSVMTIGNRATA
jgi:hypothetical protein